MKSWATGGSRPVSSRVGSKLPHVTSADLCWRLYAILITLCITSLGTDKKDALTNLTLALKIADEELEIPQMIDPADIVVSNLFYKNKISHQHWIIPSAPDRCCSIAPHHFFSTNVRDLMISLLLFPPLFFNKIIKACIKFGIKPDERSIMTQVAAFYKCFAGYNKNEVAASKIANVLQMNQEHERMIQEYVIEIPHSHRYFVYFRGNRAAASSFIDHSCWWRALCFIIYMASHRGAQVRTLGF